MKLESLFNGEVKRAILVSAADDICRESRAMALGDGWGQQIRGSQEELENLGARETDGGWIWAWLFCVVEDDPGRLEHEEDMRATAAILDALTEVTERADVALNDIKRRRDSSETLWL